MKVSKDIYLYIIEFVDIRDILNMLSVNKKYSSDKILLQVMNKRYPYLLKYKRKMKIRRFYAKMIYYICKNDIPYINHPLYNPYTIYYEYDKFNICMKYAIDINRIDIMNMMIEKGANDYNEGLLCAIKNGNINIINMMIEKGANINDFRPIATAFKKRSINIIDILLDKGCTKYDTIMKYAAKEGYIDIVKTMINKGADNFNETICMALKNKHIEIYHLLSNYANKIDDMMKSAAQGGYMDIVKLMIKKGAIAFEDALFYAIRGGNLDIVKLLTIKFLEKEPSDKLINILIESVRLNKIEITDYFLKICEEDIKKYFMLEVFISIAAKKGHLKMVLFLLEKNPENLKHAISGAASRGKMNILDYYMEKGYNDYDNILIYASEGEQIKLMKLMIKKGATNFSEAAMTISLNPHTNFRFDFTKYEKKL